MVFGPDVSITKGRLLRSWELGKAGTQAACHGSCAGASQTH